MELITKIPESLTGVRYCIEGGTERVFEEIGAPSGTTFLVRHLFYNTPARAKFLKSPAAEGNAVASVVEQLALSHPELSFKLSKTARTVCIPAETAMSKKRSIRFTAGILPGS